MTPTHVCPACETVQDRGDGYCRECGTALIPTRYCDTCGVLATHTGRYCRECGAKLPELQPTRPAPDRPFQQGARTSSAGNNKGQRPAPPPARDNENLQRRPAPPVAKPASLPQRSSPAAPQTVRQAPLSTAWDEPATTARDVVGIVSTLGGFFLVGSNPLLGMIAVVGGIMVAGQLTRRVTSQGLARLVDWVWDDPFLRRRLLGE
ncbi:MAG: zinc ribbon domain-containing protein [Chloroflexota bacterium]|nr:zinc ribbon domain-containing protein [Chloroflexota bacterium]